MLTLSGLLQVRNLLEEVDAQVAILLHRCNADVDALVLLHPLLF